MFPAALSRRFRVERELAAGGFGSVFLARQVELDRLVAVKLLHAETIDDPQQVSRFLDEGRITAQIESPHVVRVIDHGVEAGVPWIAYEYLQGRSLADAIQSGPLVPRTALLAASHVARALVAAHERGVTHRDIKPANVMDAGEGIYKVTDFGIARWSSESRVKTRTGVILGTPTHVAPEVILGAEPGPPADVYALGVTLFELITARQPFEGPTIAATLQRHVDGTALPLLEAMPSAPSELVHLMGRLLARDPAARPTAAQVLPALDGIPVVARARRTTGRTPLKPAVTAAMTQAAGVQPARSRAGLYAAGAALVLCAAGVLAWRATRRPVVVATPPPATLATDPPTPTPSIEHSLERVAPWPAKSSFEGMVPIRGGRFKLGGVYPEGLSYKADARPKKQDASPVVRVFVSTFHLDRTEVSNREYARFLASPAGAAARAARAKGVDRNGPVPPVPDNDLPAVHVRWQDAAAYCAWKKKRLPTEAEWELAARGLGGRLFPWGESFKGQSISYPPDGGHDLDVTLLENPVEATKELATVPVNRDTGDRTPEGVLHLAGNVSEWTQDWYWFGWYAWLDEPRHALLRIKPVLDDTVELPPGVREGLAPKSSRGATFRTALLRGYGRTNRTPDEYADNVGIRCACDD